MAAPVVAIERIGDLLVREGLITREQLARALEEQRQSGTRVGYNLIKLGFIEENELTKMLARQYKMPAIDLARYVSLPFLERIDPAITQKLITQADLLPPKEIDPSVYRHPDRQWRRHDPKRER